MRRLALLNRREWLLVLSGALVVLITWGISEWITHSRLPLKPQSDHITSPWVPQTVKRWETPIDQRASKYQVDPNLIAIIMTLESGGDPKASSSAGAKGLMQITPVTANEIAKKFLKNPLSNYNLSDPAGFGSRAPAGTAQSNLWRQAITAALARPTAYLKEKA
jgi:hypothetical protein